MGSTLTNGRLERERERERESERDRNDMSYKPKPARYDEFPLVSVLSRRDMDSAVSLMQDDQLFAEQIETLVEARAEIKAGLAEIARRNSLSGFRHGQLVTYYNGRKRKKTLSKRLLVENLVSIAIIDASYQLSKEYEEVKVVDLSKPKKGWMGAGDTGDTNANGVENDEIEF